MEFTSTSVANVEQQRIIREFIASNVNQPFMDIKEFMHQVRDHLNLDYDIECLDEFLEMSRPEKKYEMTVPYKKLYDYGIPVTTRSDHITRSLNRANLIENRDYKVIRGIKGIQSEFTLTHDAFFRLLQNAEYNYKMNEIRVYSDFSRFILDCVWHYSEYTNKYFSCKSDALVDTNAKLIAKIDRLEQVILSTMDESKKISNGSDMIKLIWPPPK